MKKLVVEEIEFTLRRYKRSKCIKITVYSDTDVRVSAPLCTSEKSIQSFVFRQKNWIDVQKKFVAERGTPLLCSDGGDSSIDRWKARSARFIRDKVRYWNKFYDFDYTTIRIKDMKSQWGSCSQFGNLTFHYKLIFMDESLADYVIVHELCHLKEMNHGPRFWNLVKQTIPDYKRRIYYLNKYII